MVMVIPGQGGWFLRQTSHTYRLNGMRRRRRGSSWHVAGYSSSSCFVSYLPTDDELRANKLPTPCDERISQQHLVRWLAVGIFMMSSNKRRIHGGRTLRRARSLKGHPGPGLMECKFHVSLLLGALRWHFDGRCDSGSPLDIWSRGRSHLWMKIWQRNNMDRNARVFVALPMRCQMVDGTISKKPQCPQTICNRPSFTYLDLRRGPD